MGGSCSTHGGKERSIQLRVRDHLEDSAVDGRIMLMGRGSWTGLIWFRIGRDGGGGTCKCGNESSGYINFGEFRD